MEERTYQLSRELSLRSTLGPIQQGPHDPCCRIGRTTAWRALRTTEGPALQHLEVLSGHRLRVRGFGVGAAHAVGPSVPELVGEHQDETAFSSDHPTLLDLRRSLRGMRVSRTAAVFDLLLPTILGQRVTGQEAHQSYRRIVHLTSERAPQAEGAPLLWLPPEPERVASLPTWAWHRHGVEIRRARAAIAAARRAPRLEACNEMDLAAAMERLCAVPGIGPWTASTVALGALGHLDAVITGDFHFPHTVGWALAGEARATDERMLELLAPFAPYRGYVLRLLVLGTRGAPRFGPRYAPLPIRSL